MNLSNVLDQTRIALGGAADFATDLVNPTLRLGVTGLSRSGKTVFITALVHDLIHGGRMPLFDPLAEGRLVRAYLEPQPDDDVPRFAYEEHVEALAGPERRWPQSTRRLAQLRLTVEYRTAGSFGLGGGERRLHIDIIDYPGEWLLDLPLMQQSYAQWSHAALAASRAAARQSLARDWHAFLASLDAVADADEATAQQAASLFKAYLARCRADAHAPSTLPPGRFLLPGDLEGSPLLTFAPLEMPEGEPAPPGSLRAMMERRYDAYVRRVARPFFRDHFARLDRQIVLVDALTALNAGAAAVADLGSALGDVLACFRQGQNSLLTVLFGKRIDRILFAATKADLLHHSSHDRLEAILRLLVARSAERARFAGARVDVAALASVRATREASVRRRGETLSCIVGVPEQGETIGAETFDGETEAAIFPGDLPSDPEAALARGIEEAVRFVRFRPPRIDPSLPLDAGAGLPHIRLDRALNFLIGDRLA